MGVRKERRRLSYVAFALAVVTAHLIGCQSSSSASRPIDPAPANYNDHTQSSVASLSEFEALSAEARGIRELKFLVLDVTDEKSRTLRFLDGKFYRFHDEWYWLHLLAGHSPPGDAVVSRHDYGFSTPEEASEWAIKRVDRGEELPLKLRLVEGERLYADRFYEASLWKKPQRYGLGSVFRLARGESQNTWAFKLEYADEIDATELQMYFALLEQALPAEIAEQLVFVARSPQQHEAIASLKEEAHPLGARLKKYSELVLPGQVEVYSPGLTAGRLRIVPATEPIPVVDTSGDILVLASLPDELPQAAGLITAVPQTPLAHVNLLAQNRGIPNLHLGGALEDVQLQQMAWDEMPVVLEAREGGYSLRPLDRKTYALWQKLTKPVPPTFEPLDWKNLEYLKSLTSADVPHVDTLRRQFGGKVAGYLMLLSGEATTPGDVLALSVRPFHEHLARLQRWVRPTLEHPRFENSEYVRYLVLEGVEAFLQRFPKGGDGLEREAVRKRLPLPMRELLQRGGLRQAIRDLPLAVKTRDLLTQKISEHFSELDKTQGLRFRSSSNVEDLEGFNGAGLYSSNTGFIHAAELVSPKDQARTIEAALKNTWASFYSFEAFEERRSAGISPFVGGMGVLIHPRFDDQWEVANGVFTLTIDGTSRASQKEPRFTLIVNTQEGAESVTNALSGVTPEVLEMTGVDPKEPSWKLLSPSSRRASPVPILTKGTLRDLFRQAIAVGRKWLLEENRRRPAGHERRSVTLDFEFRYMAPEWPRLTSGPKAAAPRLILKQVRSLEPGAPARHEELQKVALPPELFGRAAKIERRRCQGKNEAFEVILLWTRERATPNFGYEKSPFVVSLRSSSAGGVASLFVGHEGLSQTFDPSTLGAAWHAHLLAPARDGLDSVVFDGKTLARHYRDGRRVSEAASCQTEVLLDHPERLLREALEKVE